MKQRVILFDINETVLNLRGLRPKFKALFGCECYTDTWFSMLLHASTVSMITGVETNFSALAGITLEALAARSGVNLSGEKIDEILGGFSSLSAHPDIMPALSKLRAAGFMTVAFSNSSLALISEQVKNAGLNNYFDEVISVEEVGTFKPSSKAYRLASAKLGKPPGQLRLVAAHDWDTHGAICAGLEAAYIDRSGAPYNPLYNKPEIFGATMDEVVDQIISADIPV